MGNFVGRTLTANIAEQSVALNIEFISYIKNESDNVVTVSFDTATTGTETMVLKANEGRTNLEIPFKTLYYKADVNASELVIEGTIKPII